MKIIQFVRACADEISEQVKREEEIEDLKDEIEDLETNLKYCKERLEKLSQQTI